MSDKRLYGIRGATFCENTKESIASCVGELFRLIFSQNALISEDIVSIQFTMTDDLDAMNPAAALRRAEGLGLDVSAIPLFCSQEVRVAGMPEKTIRVLVTSYMTDGSVVRHAYINGAQALRPDLGESGK